MIFFQGMKVSWMIQRQHTTFILRLQIQKFHCDFAQSTHDVGLTWRQNNVKPTSCACLVFLGFYFLLFSPVHNSYDLTHSTRHLMSKATQVTSTILLQRCIGIACISVTPSSQRTLRRLKTVFRNPSKLTLPLYRHKHLRCHSQDTFPWQWKNIPVIRNFMSAKQL